MWATRPARGEWLKEGGPGYQARANRILREKMMEDVTG
jgi:uncharacterized protein (DUF4415 family)